MTDAEAFVTPLKDLGFKDLDDNLGKLTLQKFYSPLCVAGYLTPLQRKKLREKRSNASVDVNNSSLKEIKKVRVVKRKKEIDPVVRDKGKDRIKRIRTNDNIQQVRCIVSRIVHKSIDNNIKTKKFFKSSSSDRLEKVNFTMPLVLKKNVFLDIRKYVSESLSDTRKLFECKENSSCDHSSKGFGCAEESSKTKDSQDDYNMLSFQMCQNSEISRKSNSCVTWHENLDHISLPKEEKSIFKFDWPSDDELLKRQEKARADLRKKNVLREANNLHEHKNEENENKKQIVGGNQVKLYPIFQIAMKKQLRSNDDIKRNLKNVSKKIKDSSKGGEQMIIDAGQKEIGAKICCTCSMIYTIGQLEDERLHLSYHDMYLINLKFPGWKEENVIGEYCDGRVIMIRKTDKSFKLKKVEDVLQVANRDLGFPSSAIPSKSDLTFLLFISKDKQVAGCVVAEPISKAFQVLLAGDKPTSKDASEEKIWKIGNWYSSSEAVPAVCGVNRIWVAHSFRRHKMASRMVDCLRCHFIHGYVIGIRELAFTDPSPDGREFAASYTGTDNFLVYK